MPDIHRVGARQYYDYLPTAAHRCGDIWGNLPTFDLLPTSTTSGIIVTPDCDLVNNKTETVTYLPIVSVRDYFRTRGALPLVKSKIIGKLKAGRLPTIPNLPMDDFSYPSRELLTSTEAEINAYLGLKQRGAAEVMALEAAAAGCAFLRDAQALIREVLATLKNYLA